MTDPVSWDAIVADARRRNLERPRRLEPIRCAWGCGAAAMVGVEMARHVNRHCPVATKVGA